MDVPVADEVVLFEGFRFDRRGGGLFRQDASGGFVPVAIGQRALDVLAFLIAHRGELVSKHAIMQAVWRGIAVEDKNLAVHISALRRVLDNGREHRAAFRRRQGAAIASWRW
jgi:DNA-binding winged helix-turn-helix (wHTH) protein